MKIETVVYLPIMADPMETPPQYDLNDSHFLDDTHEQIKRGYSLTEPEFDGQWNGGAGGSSDAVMAYKGPDGNLRWAYASDIPNAKHFHRFNITQAQHDAAARAAAAETFRLFHIGEAAGGGVPSAAEKAEAAHSQLRTFKLQQMVHAQEDPQPQFDKNMDAVKPRVKRPKKKQ